MTAIPRGGQGWNLLALGNGLIARNKAEGASDIALSWGEITFTSESHSLTLESPGAIIEGLCYFDYQERNEIRIDQGGIGLFDILVSGVTAIGKAIVGQADWDYLEVVSELYYIMRVDDI